MADATARFTLTTDVDASSAGPATSALEKLAAKIKEDTKALGELQKAMKNLQGGTNVNIEAFKSLQKQIDAKKSSLAGASESFLGLGGNLGKLSSFAKKAGSDAGEARGGLEGFLGVVQAGGGPVAGFTSKLQQVGTALAGLGPGGLLALAVIGVLALTAVVVVGIGALMHYALGLGDAARSAGILREAATGSAVASARLDKEIGVLASRVPTARAELEKLANDLARSGLAGNALETALSAIAVTSSVMGQAAGSAIQGIVERARASKRFLLSAFDLQGTGLKIQEVGAAVAKRLGISVQAAIAALQNGQVKLADGLAALDDAVQSKFGGAAAKQMLAFPTQIAKAKENLDRLFSGVNIEPLLIGLRQVLSLLDENSATGKAAKVVLETLLNPLFQAVGSQGGLIRSFFQGVVIAALMFAIAVKQAGKEYSAAFPSSGLAGLDLMRVALNVGIGAFQYFTSGVLFAIQVLGALAGAAGSVVGFISGAFGALSSLDLAGTATQLVTGFVNGLLAGPGLVAQAAGNLARAALSSIKGVLGIASPAKEPAKLAGFAVQGFTNEIDDSAPDVQASMADAFAVPGKTQGGASKPLSAKTSDGKIFNFYGDWYIGDRKALQDKSLEDDMTAVLELAVARAGL